MYSLAAMYNVPTISSICDAINHGSKGTDILSRIYAAILTYPAGAQQPKCQSLNWQVIYNMDTILGWDWQVNQISLVINYLKFPAFWVFN